MINELWIILRSLYFWTWTITATIFFGIFNNSLILFGAQDWMHHIASFWGKTLSFVSGTNLIVEGSEKIFRKGPVIILSNHQSMFDIVVIYTFLDIQFRWLAKASLFRIPVLGWGMRGGGNIPVERGDKRKALHSLFSAAEEIRAGKSVIIFPEGTRGHEDGTMLEFKKGAFILAKKAEVTLQPVTIWGANKIVPVQKDKWFQRIYPGTVHIIIHDPISPEAIKNMNTDELSLHVRKIMEEPMPELRKKLKLD